MQAYSDPSRETDIRRRCTAKGFTSELTDESVTYALVCHEQNRKLYCTVMR